MKKSLRILVAMMAIALMVGVVNAQSLNLTTSPSFKDHNFAITKFMINGTAGTLKATEFATLEEPMIIVVDSNETISISLKEWGIDSSRSGVILNIRNGTDPEPNSKQYLVPLQRFGWGSQVDEVTFGNLKIRVGLTEIFRGKSAEYAKLSIMAIKLSKK